MREGGGEGWGGGVFGEVEETRVLSLNHTPVSVRPKCAVRGL